MSQEISYTTEEISKLLKISKLTVYDLIKKGELSSYRVGKQMRVDASDLEAYKLKSKGTHTQVQQEPQAVISPSSSMVSQGIRPLVLTGQDISLDILAKHLEKKTTGLRPLRSYAGSLDSLISMYKGESDIVSTHLLDGDTGEYNLPYIRKLLVGSSYLVVNLLSRNAGIYVAQGNPHNIKNWSDLSRPGLRFVNREKGSGARVLLDEQLRLHGIKTDQLKGYNYIQTDHLSVAAKVASGEADVGVGIEKTASIVDQIEFISLIQERYDLVMIKNAENQSWINALMLILQSKDFKQGLQAIAGYDLSRTGEILFET
ncbi:helix-turn-helix transcriptional regulator [Paenibacillus alkaliterrae]|uniref:helix-turn-helix transcriptional regulator n=1 Tax=Paenibacillus alkaliterrae TaxID=320909 RepID=UPI001F474158|nr:helix-turn-helix transcriptional regulator [Paenibacillus alkaliterrae]MCF2940515.1 helix-turn-helix transcriptional regulator [Paenibacillus alkaliterrae]